MMRYQRVEMVIHWGVRDAAKGEEGWITYEHRPLLAVAERGFSREMREAGYLRFAYDWRWDHDLHARWFIWPAIVVTSLMDRAWWAGLRFLGRFKLLHSSAEPSRQTRFRDLRPGP